MSTASPTDEPGSLEQKFNAWLQQRGATAHMGVVFLSTNSKPIDMATMAAWVSSPPAIAPHASRTAPHCIDCRHLEPEWQMNCQHPQQPVYLTDGKSKVRTHVARGNEQRCITEGFAYCGFSAALFEPLDGADDSA